MDGFAVSGRVQRSAPRLVRDERRDARAATDSTGTDVVELVDDGPSEPLVDRWAAFRDRWSALTFYLFDPQSWR
jgi:hypothetical protein